ncbi:MAG: GNAT family N-acetyltransferase [Bacteroidaceae bacterium]|nr:GNAT family N-acetyltransferase [Bacteroidaceae bacterium]
MTVTIIPATTVDIPAIRSMAEIAFRHTYSSILTAGQVDYMMEWMYSTESLEKQFMDGHRFFIAVINDAPCGYLSIQKERVTEDDVTVYHLHKLYIMPDRQACGTGKMLFNEACEYVSKDKETAKARIELNVNRYNKALGFYLKMGMKIAEEGDFAIGNGYYMNDYIMSLEL